MSLRLKICLGLAFVVAVFGIGRIVTTASADSTIVAATGEVLFDSAFAGATTDEKITAMNSWARAQGGGGRHPVVVFDAKNYSFSRPIMLYSGLKLKGITEMPGREYSTGTSFTWSGPAGTAMFAFPGTQTGQSYPSDGSPRDISMESIVFNGTTATDFMQRIDPDVGGNGAGHTLWATQFHNVGWKNFATVMWGYWDGVTISGTVHIQGVADTAFKVGGSENVMFAAEQAVMDANSSYAIVTNSKPFIISKLSKSTIGHIMVTARKGGSCLEVTYGHGSIVDGFQCDAQDSDPMYGAGIRIKGGEGLRIVNSSLKGMMGTPASGAGGRANNRGWITVSGGRQILVESTNFHRGGSALATTDTPLVWAGPNATDVKLGLNTVSGFGGVRAHVGQAAAGKIVNIDPSVTVDTTP